MFGCQIKSTLQHPAEKKQNLEKTEAQMQCAGSESHVEVSSTDWRAVSVRPESAENGWEKGKPREEEL